MFGGLKFTAHHRSQRLRFLQAAQVLLRTSLVVHSPLLPARLTKAILPSISKILPVHSEPSPTGASVNGGTNKKGKKRARGYEGDELFKTSKEVVCPTIIDDQVILTALDGKLMPFNIFTSDNVSQLFSCSYATLTYLLLYILLHRECF